MSFDPKQLPISKLSQFVSSSDLSTEQKHRLINHTKGYRESYNQQVSCYNEHLRNNQLMVKISVTATLGIGLFFVAPATLLIGGAVALNLGSGIYSLLPFPQAKIDAESLSDCEDLPIDKAQSEKLVHDWLLKVKDHELTDEQSRLYHNMYRIGVGLIVAFATFTAIASGASLAVALSASLFALSLFYFTQNQPTVYIEDQSQQPAMQLAH